MADNSLLNPGSGPEKARAVERSADIKTQVVMIDMGGAAGPEALLGGGTSMPVTDASSQSILSALQALIATIAGTIALADSPFVAGSPGQIMLAKRRDSDSTAVADGDLNTLNMDEEGRLKVASKPASYIATVGNVTSATSTVFVNTERFSNLMIHCTGTFAGANCTFEGSLNSTNGTDGNWFGVQAIRTSANTIETTTGVLAAAPAYAWELSVNALKYFRIRATAWTSGTQVWTLVPGTYATEPIPGAQVSSTQPVSGTVAATQSTRGTVGAGWYVEPDNILVADIASAALTSTATSATITPTPVGGSAVFSVVVAAVTGTSPTLDIVIQESDDSGTNWYDIYHFPRITSGAQVLRTPHIPLSGNRIRYVRTVGGTTPSFTHGVNRITHQMVSPPPYRQIFDRTISLTTLNSVTPSLLMSGASNFQLTVNIGTATTAPALTLEGSDDNGVTWYALDSVTAIASSTQRVIGQAMHSERIRARVGTAGSAVVAGYVQLKAYGF